MMKDESTPTTTATKNWDRMRWFLKLNMSCHAFTIQPNHLYILRSEKHLIIEQNRTCSKPAHTHMLQIETDTNSTFIYELKQNVWCIGFRCHVCFFAFFFSATFFPVRIKRKRIITLKDMLPKPRTWSRWIRLRHVFFIHGDTSTPTAQATLLTSESVEKDKVVADLTF